MFNVNQIFGQRRLRKNEVLDKKAQKQVNETKSLLENEDWGTAEILIQDLIRKHPHNADCCWLYGRLCAHNRQFDDAIFHFKHCIQLVPTHSDCYCTYGATLGILKKYDQEQEMYKKCLEYNPKHHLCHYNYGRLCAVKGDSKNAEKHYQEAIEIHTEDANYYTHYGLLLKSLKRNDEAQKQFEIACTLNPKDAKVHYLYSKLLQSMGHLTEAINTLKKACKLNPKNTEYQRLLYILNRSKPKARLKRSESAIPRSAGANVESVKTTPGGPGAAAPGSTLHDLLYNNDMKQKQTKSIDLYKSKSASGLAAVSDTEPVEIDNNPLSQKADDDDAYFKKAVVLYKNKKYDEAESILKLVISVKPNHEQAQRLYKYLSQKLYEKKDKKAKKAARHKKTNSSPNVLGANAKEFAKAIMKEEVAENKQLKEHKENKDENDGNSNKINDERDPCQLEFIRFLEDRVKLNKQYPDLYQRFEALGYDNIRMVFDFDTDILLNEVKIKRLHCKIFMRKIAVFTAEADAFRAWLKRITSSNQQYGSMDGLIDRLENEGILTFESLYRFVFTKKDLINIIGKEFTNIHHILWREIQNQQTDLMAPESVVNPAYSTRNDPNIAIQQVIQPGNDEQHQEEGKTKQTSLQ